MLSLESLIVSPHPQYTYGSLFFENLVDQAVLDVDAAGIGAFEVTDKLFEGWWILKRVGGQDIE